MMLVHSGHFHNSGKIMLLLEIISCTIIKAVKSWNGESVTTFLFLSFMNRIRKTENTQVEGI
jgi:hypothetical protein